MTQAAFTAGPWRISDARTVDGNLMVVGGEGHGFGLIAEVSEEADANAIAAAPDMYAALGEIAAIANELSWDAKSRAIAERLHAITGPARAKAEGR